MGMKNKTEAEFRSSVLDLANDRSHLIPLSESQGFASINGDTARDFPPQGCLAIGQNKEPGA
jgi:hypothetical protein